MSAIPRKSGVDRFRRRHCVTTRASTASTRRRGFLIRLPVGGLDIFDNLRLIAPVRIIDPDRRRHPLRRGVRDRHVADTDRFWRFIAILVAAIVIIVALLLALLILLLRRALFVLPLTEFIDHAVIMIRILQIIFRRHPVTRLADIARQLPIFLEQLDRVAANPHFVAVAHVGPGTWNASDSRSTTATITTTATPAAAILSISYLHE